MPVQLNAIRLGRASLLLAGLMATLTSCTEPPTRIDGPAVALNGDASTNACTYPDEGCPCAEGDGPVECIVNPPIMQGAQVMCQHGSRVCRTGLWSACENITLFAPSRNKILGGAGISDICHPDAFTQGSVPDATDLPTHGVNLDYTNGAPSGILLETVTMGMVENFGLGHDTDGDGVPDSVDDCPADVTRWVAPCTGPAVPQGFFHILPPGAEPPYDPMMVNLTVKSVDTYILIDTTMSMDGEIGNLRTGLSTLMSNVRTIIPDAYMGLGMFREFPVSLDGQNNDFPYIHVMDPTASLVSAQAAANQILDVEGNSFWPEAGAHALYSVASGEGLGPWVPNRVCTNGGFGWPCFRTGAVPVVIIATDAPFWNGASFAAPVGNANRRTDLSHNPFPGTNGTTTVAGMSLPRAITPDPAVESPAGSGTVVRTGNTAATAIQLGDLTNSSITVLGSNNAATGTAMSNANTLTCGGLSQNGPDVFYEFTISGLPNGVGRAFQFEAFADFDPTLFIQPLSAGAPTLTACDLDSGSLLDGDSRAVWRTGSKIMSAAIPNSSVVPVTTNAAFVGCNASANPTATPMTGCNIASTTTPVVLNSCTVPSTIATSTLANCSVSNTPSRFTNCTVPSTTSTTLNSCTLNTTTTASSTFSSCTTPTATTNTSLSGCAVDIVGATTRTVSEDDCDVWWGYDPGTLSGCVATHPTLTETYSGCSTVSVTPRLTGCRVETTNQVFTTCKRSSRDNAWLYCDRLSGNADSQVDGYVVSGNSSLPTGTRVIGHDNNDSSQFYLYLDRDIPNGNYGTLTVTRPTKVLSNCSAVDADPTSGFLSTGSSLLGSGSSNTISAATSYTDSSGNQKWYLTMQNAMSSAGTLGTITSGAAIPFHHVECSSRTGSSVYPDTSGATISGAGITGAATVTSYCRNCGGAKQYVIYSAGISGATSSITVSALSSTWSNVLTCTSKSSYVTTRYEVSSDSSDNLTDFTNITAISGSAGNYQVTLEDAPSGQVPNGTIGVESRDATWGQTIYCYTNSAASPSGTVPTSGMSVTGNSNIPSGATVGSVSYVDPWRGDDYYQFYILDSSGRAITPAGSVSRSGADLVLTGTTGGTLSTTMRCSGASPSAPLYGSTLTGSGIPTTGAATTISGGTAGAAMALSGGNYVITLSRLPSAQISGSVTSSYSGPDRTQLTCNLTGTVIPQSHWTTAGGSNLNSSTVTSFVANGGASYTFTLSPGASTDTAQLTSLSGVDRRIFRNCKVTTGTTPLVGATLGGMSLGASPSATVVSVPNGSGQFDVTMNVAATSSTPQLTTATSNTPQLRLLQGCTLTAGDPVPSPTVPLSGTLIAGGTNVTGIAPGSVMGTYDLTTDTNATSVGITTASTSGFQLNKLTGCTYTGDAPVANMVLTGSNLAAGTTTIQSATPTGGGTYTIMLSQNAANSMAMLASGTLTTTQLDRMTGCMVTSGTPLVGQVLTGTRLQTGTAIQSLIGTGAGPYTVMLANYSALSAGATTAAGTITVANASPPRLTGCQNNPGFLLLDGIEVTGTDIQPGTTITSFTGLGTPADPWIIDLNTVPTGTGTMDMTVNALLPGPTNRLTNCQLASGSILTGMNMSGPLVAGGSTLTSYVANSVNPTRWDLILSDELTGLTDAMNPTTNADGTFTTPPSGAGAFQFPNGLTNGTYRLIVDSRTTNEPSARSSPGRGTFQVRIRNLTSTTNGMATTAAVERPWSATATKLQSAGIRTIGIRSCPTSGSSDAAKFCPATLYDLQQLGVATGSVRSDGTPFVYTINENGTGLTTAIATGVQELAQYILFDVRAQCVDASGNPCNALFESAYATPTPAGCTSCSGPDCNQCRPGTNLPYRVEFHNPVAGGIAQTNVPQIFNYFIVLIDRASNAEMSRAPVRLVVPALTTTTVQPTGTFTQLYDATYQAMNGTGCDYANGRRAKWGNFTYSDTIPAGTAISFRFRVGGTAAEAATATPVTVSAVSGTNTVNLDAVFAAAGTPQYQPFVQMVATLASDPTNTLTPILQSYNLEYVCVDIE